MSEEDQPVINLRSFLVNPDQLDKELLCGICKKLVIGPQECQECEQLFCSNCIYEWLINNTKQCPKNCSQKCWQLRMPHKIVLRSIEKLQIKCVNKNCDRTMQYKELKDHLKTCDKVAFKCSQGCEQIINKNEFDEHLKICDLRIEFCYKCQTEYKFIEKHDCINYMKEQIKNLQQENQDLKNHLVVTNIKLDEQEQRIQQLMEQNKNCQTNYLLCDKGHNLQWVKSKYDLQCNKCAQYTSVIRYECNTCNYFICQKCTKPICKNQQCPLQHYLIYAQYKQEQLQAPVNLVCDLCNRYLNFLKIGVYSDRECDFDLCEDCFNKFYS